MTIYYSATTRGFYDSQIHAELPADAVEVSEDGHRGLIDGQSAGKRIVPDAGGYPMLADPPAPTLAEAKAAKLAEIATARKADERQGVTVNAIRYAGDPGNRQALGEAIEYADAEALTAFPSWKSSDDAFIADHPVQDVRDAYAAIGARRSQLIAREGEKAAAIAAAEDLATLEGITW